MESQNSQHISIVKKEIIYMKKKLGDRFFSFNSSAQARYDVIVQQWYYSSDTSDTININSDTINGDSSDSDSLIKACYGVCRIYYCRLAYKVIYPAPRMTYHNSSHKPTIQITQA